MDAEAELSGHIAVLLGIWHAASSGVKTLISGRFRVAAEDLASEISEAGDADAGDADAALDPEGRTGALELGKAPYVSLRYPATVRRIATYLSFYRPPRRSAHSGSPQKTTSA